MMKIILKTPIPWAHLLLIYNLHGIGNELSVDDIGVIW